MCLWGYWYKNKNAYGCTFKQHAWVFQVVFALMSGSWDSCCCLSLLCKVWHGDTANWLGVLISLTSFAVTSVITANLIKKKKKSRVLWERSQAIQHYWDQGGLIICYLLSAFVVMLINMEKTRLLWCGCWVVDDGENKQSNKDAHFTLSLLLAVDVTSVCFKSLLSWLPCYNRLHPWIVS